MSYYILPKNNVEININYDLKTHEDKNNYLPIYTSFSIHNYYNIMYKELTDILSIQMTSDNDIQLNHDTSLNKVTSVEHSSYQMNDFHTHEYVYSNIPGTKYRVSKLKTNSNFFYDFFEILVTLNCFDCFNYSIRFLHIGDNYLDTINCLETLRDKYNDTILYNINNESIIHDTIDRCEFLFYEINDEDFNDLNSYVLKMVDILIIIIKLQKENGTTIIKINNIFYKPIIDILYILSSMFEKIIIFKPNVTNIISFNKYVICKSFLYNVNREKIYTTYLNKLLELKREFIMKTTTMDKNNNTVNIYSIINNDIPCYFINKLDDINIIMGQQQLEYICQIINIFKNTNKNEKMELIRKTNIQKCVLWCEKFKIPCNKFLDKTNVFYN
jgi:hypothetical protein